MTEGLAHNGQEVHICEQGANDQTSPSQRPWCSGPRQVRATPRSETCPCNQMAHPLRTGANLLPLPIPLHQVAKHKPVNNVRIIITMRQQTRNVMAVHKALLQVLYTYLLIKASKFSIIPILHI